MPDVQMRNFIAISDTHDDQLSIQSRRSKSCKKTKTLTIGGELDEYEGVFVKVKRARDKRVVISHTRRYRCSHGIVHPNLIEVIRQKIKHISRTKNNNRWI